MYYTMSKKQLSLAPTIFERNYQSQEDWEYIDDPTYTRSIGSHVCITCSRFDYICDASCGSLLFCNWHQKLLFHGLHLTHSCGLFEKHSKFKSENKSRNQLKTA